MYRISSYRSWIMIPKYLSIESRITPKTKGYFKCHFVVIFCFTICKNNDDWYVYPKGTDVLWISFLAKDAEKRWKAPNRQMLHRLQPLSILASSFIAKTPFNLRKKCWPTVASQWFANWFEVSDLPIGMYFDFFCAKLSRFVFLSKKNSTCELLKIQCVLKKSSIFFNPSLPSIPED